MDSRPVGLPAGSRYPRKGVVGPGLVDNQRLDRGCEVQDMPVEVDIGREGTDREGTDREGTDREDIVE